ncbi:hypothetical protein [Citrobacter amalonaticus]|uniref:hypothetical protein n=1 Tax=Citrobacter amalonaticus TaxID=35703 RepID=UPI00229B0375|nr:hypothetical protein [Citrobacter amalonaticus]HCB1891345.1 hypothetical protein [Citrobacter amalonaticus]HCB1913347.1 hypothetical protein [Citrobacter amalonaticus]HCW3113091.1 hypothetical protein [Citrobacter amalonaticus]
MSSKYDIPEATPNGIKIGNRVISWSGAVKQFDGPRFDSRPSEGLRWLACIMDAEASGWVALYVKKELILWRWLVATVFINEERDRNGTIDIPNESGGVDIAVIYSGKKGDLSIYPGPLRFSLANHVEGVAIEKYGVEKGSKMALRMYQDMVIADPGDGFRMSPFGREGLEMLHDDYIGMIKTSGMPEMPVMH